MENSKENNPKPIGERTFEASFVNDTPVNLTPDQQAVAAELQRKIFEREYPELVVGPTDELASIRRDLENGLVIPPKLPHQTLTRKKKKN